MAHRVAIRSAEAQGVTSLKRVYVTDTPVGSGSANKKLDDIELVQVFLHDFFDNFPELFKSVKKPPRPIGPGILIDGIVGPQTLSAITVFQSTVNDPGGSNAADGRVSVPKSSVLIPGTKSPYTIIRLNSFFFLGGSDGNLAFNENLEDHPLVQTSPHLIAELKRRKALT